jgi:UDP-N-acetylmuramoyl-tripeptide--D-alanyl-D-alanine ligase
MSAIFTLPDLVLATRGEVVGRPPVTLKGVGIDSRTVTPGSVYVAILGEQHDGHDFVEAAVAAGAALCVVQRGRAPARGTALEVDDTRVALGQIARAWRRRSLARLVGITGSTGKTSTKQLLAAALGAIGPTLATSGSLNNETGVPLTLLGLEDQHQFAVIEMGMRGLGQIAYLRGLALPDVGVVVNAGSAHVGVVGSVERIATGKSEIWLGGGIAVRPAEDARLAALARQRGVKQELTYGEDGDVRVLAATPGAGSGSEARFAVRGVGEVEAVIGLAGRHNADNAACALAVCLALGVDVRAAAAGLASARPAPHRAEQLSIGGRIVIDDCYNANPTSMRAAVAMLVELAAGARTVAVIGDMLELGDQAAAEHQALGRLLAERRIGQVIALGARTGDLAEGLAGAPLLLPADHEAAGRALAEHSRPGDVVLVKGSRGMRLEQVIAAFARAVG